MGKTDATLKKIISTALNGQSAFVGILHSSEINDPTFAPFDYASVWVTHDFALEYFFDDSGRPERLYLSKEEFLERLKRYLSFPSGYSYDFSRIIMHQAKKGEKPIVYAQKHSFLNLKHPDGVRSHLDALFSMCLQVKVSLQYRDGYIFIYSGIGCMGTDDVVFEAHEKQNQL